MAKASFGAGPTGKQSRGSQRAAPVRYWTGELGCSEDELRKVVAAIGTNAGDVRRRLALRRGRRETRSGAGRGPAVGAVRREA